MGALASFPRTCSSTASLSSRVFQTLGLILFSKPTPDYSSLSQAYALPLRIYKWWTTGGQAQAYLISLSPSLAQCLSLQVFSGCLLNQAHILPLTYWLHESSLSFKKETPIFCLMSSFLLSCSHALSPSEDKLCSAPVSAVPRTLLLKCPIAVYGKPCR